MKRSLVRFFIGISGLLLAAPLSANPEAMQSTGSRPSLGSAADRGIVAPPRIEVRRGSGDFQSWHSSIVIDGTTAVWLRWSPSAEGTASARWTTDSVPIGPPGGVRPEPSGHVGNAPDPGQWALFSISLFSPRTGGIPAGPTRYTLRLTARDAQGEDIGLPSAPITIDYKPPGSGPAQVIQLDSVQLLDWSPKSGLMHGTNDSQSHGYESNQKLDLDFRIELVTESEARMDNNLIGADGRALHGNFYSFVDVSGKGVHTKSNYVTIRCDDNEWNPYYEQTATGVSWKLWRKSDNAVLAEGTKTFATPLVWRCPGGDMLTLTSHQPNAGTIKGIETPGDATKAGRSVTLNYQYRLGSQPKAVVNQRVSLANGQPISNQYWTDATVNNGTGNVSNRLSIYCQSEQQPDVKAERLVYSLRREGTGEAILQEVVDVDWVFTCKPPKIVPGLAGPQGVLNRIGGQGASDGSQGRASERMQKVAPSGRMQKVAPDGRMQKVVPPERGQTVPPAVRPMPAVPSANDSPEAAEKQKPNLMRKRELR